MAMQSGLVLARKEGEQVVIDLREWGLGLLRVINLEQRYDKTKLMFSGDKRIPIHRLEVFEAIERSKKSA